MNTTTLLQFHATDEFGDTVHCLHVIPAGIKTAAEALALGVRALIVTNDSTVRVAFEHDEMRIALTSVREVHATPAELLGADTTISLITGQRHIVAENELDEMEAAIDAETERAVAAAMSLAEQLEEDDELVLGRSDEAFDETPVRDDILMGLG